MPVSGPEMGATKPLSVLVVHNKYRQPGGEDAVFDLETRMLESYGHRVTRLVFDNADIPEPLAPLTAARLAAATVWSPRTVRLVRRAVREARVDVAHFHNTFPLVSPSAYAACKMAGVPVVQTLHNYRLLCPNALFFRNGHTCEDCLDRKLPWPGILHACYRESRGATAAVTAMLTTHRLTGTWTEMVDLYVALTEFARQKFIASGFPPDKIVVKPNFVHPDPGPGAHDGGYLLFVGRLSPEKGIGTLLEAWARLGGRGRLKIAGDGPLKVAVQQAAASLPGLEYLGRCTSAEIYALMGAATAVLVPSEWYETFGRVVAEAFATGAPVLGSDIGAVAELVAHERTGLRFRAGDAAALAAAIEWAWAHPCALAEMGRAARREFETRYTAEHNHQILMDGYTQAISQARKRAESQ